MQEKWMRAAAVASRHLRRTNEAREGYIKVSRERENVNFRLHLGLRER